MYDGDDAAAGYPVIHGSYPMADVAPLEKRKPVRSLILFVT